MSSPKKAYGKGILIAAVILLLAGINLLASLWHQRIDLTGEKRFTLSAPTKKMLKKIEGEVKIDILLKGDFPSAFKRLANSAEETLQEFKEVAGNKITYRFVMPDDELDEVNTTLPPLFSLIHLATNFWARSNGANTFVSKLLRTNSIGISNTGPASPLPALLNRMSISQVNAYVTSK